MKSLQNALEGRSPTWLVGCGAAFTLLVGTVERAVPVGDSIWVLSLLPIALITRYANWAWATAVAVVSLLPFLLFPPSFVDPAPNPVAGAEPLLRFVLMLGLVYLVNGNWKGERRANPSRAVKADPSTGLVSTRDLFDLIAVELERADRYGRPFTMAYVGIDNLSAVRLRAGEQAALAIVANAAHEIRKTIRSLDHVTLLRDHEFALLLPETGPDAAAIVLDRMQQVLERSFSEERPAVSFAVGAITWIQASLSAEELHQQAYQLMYGARHENVALKHVILDDVTHASNSHMRRRAEDSPAANVGVPRR